ncbi:MarR family winged helix-turn-helix transcriptional regulator [Rhizorhabdus wittichii]|uniref:MarR family winged helix-turn-helix transcriptional regulator n=1 Tax=Rhizorhabdus wittichii TaxID=160791 RepID=UPI00030D5638|nr:MarR family transcriptional regulator [Rhizorhabdus wittichii]ARR55137.1 MarR family transcriptional regulator [Rhizorhabdus wittichii DC-6]
MIALNRTFLGRLSEQLSELIEQQSAEVFKRAGLVIPVKSSSLLVAIATLGPVSVADLVRALGRSHQLIQQKIPKLVTLGLVTRQPDPDDQRIILIEITDKGREQLALLDSLDEEFERAYAEMEEDAGPVFDTIDRAINSLRSRPLIERMVISRISMGQGGY